MTDNTRSKAETAQQAIPFECQPDSGFMEWLARSGGSLAVSTYQAGKLLLLGWNGNQISLLLRHFDKPMGLDANTERMVLATRNALLAFGNAPALAPHYREQNRYDALYLPRAIWPSPDLNLHDVSIAPDGETWMVATRFNCLANPSTEHTFLPRWRPPFISDLVPEDRCHLNGLAMVDGRPGFVTALGETDELVGWRENKAGGGILMHVDSGEVIARGFAMPHSPRWHGGRLYVLNSGAGELLQVDPDSGKTETVCCLQGYLRGLTFVGNHAIVGLCQIRETNIFGGMPVQAAHDELLCAVAIIDMTTGRRLGLLNITSGCSELFDIRFLDGIRRPQILRPDQEECLEAVSAPDCYYWLRPENVVEEKKI